MLAVDSAGWGCLDFFLLPNTTLFLLRLSVRRFDADMD